MKMVVEFDIGADIIDVPQSVIDNRERLRTRFLKWLFDKNTKHKYWVEMKDSTGTKLRGVCYRSNAFVEWLNKKVLSKTGESAVVLAENIFEYPDDLPKIFF